MREPEDPPPSYEDVVAGGNPPQYSRVAGPREEIRVCPGDTTNQNTQRVPQSIPGRATRGKWYGKHHLVPSSSPVRTMCQREPSQETTRSHRMWIQQEGSLNQLNNDFWPNKKFSNCCLIVILISVVLFILMLGRIMAMIEDKKPLDTVERHWERPMFTDSSTPDGLATIKNCSYYNDDNSYIHACFTPPPSIKDGTFIPAIQPQQCYDEEMKLVEYFPEGKRSSISCNPNKVLSVNLVFLEPGYTGSLAMNIALRCTGGSWRYPDWKYQPYEKPKYDKWIEVKESPVDCITETELIKRNIG